MFIFVFFKQKTAYEMRISDWSSDVCSSDLLSLQACADDPQVAYHAIRDLARIAKETGAAATRWTVMGFGRASAAKERKSGVEGTSESVRVDLGGCRIIKKKKEV